MLTIYDSFTGLTKKAALKFDEKAINIKEVKEINKPCILFTRVQGFGEIPTTTKEFLEYRNNKDFVIGVVVSGNRNWGLNFGISGDKIQERYGIPLISKIEASGLQKDIDYIRQWVKENTPFKVDLKEG